MSATESDTLFASCYDATQTLYLCRLVSVSILAGSERDLDLNSVVLVLTKMPTEMSDFPSTGQTLRFSFSFCHRFFLA